MWIFIAVSADVGRIDLLKGKNILQLYYKSAIHCIMWTPIFYPDLLKKIQIFQVRVSARYGGQNKRYVMPRRCALDLFNHLNNRSLIVLNLHAEL